MPFTLSHPAIILPFLRLTKRHISKTAIIMGSLTPDFEYFIRMRHQSLYSHTWAGLFLFDVPMAFFLAILFQYVMKKNMIENLPLFIRTRVNSAPSNWIDYVKKYPFTVFISLLIGASSHILWDEFTHSGGIFVEWFPVLEMEISLFGTNWMIYRILQHLSSLVGAIIIFFVFMSRPPKYLVTNTINFKYWILFSIICAFIFTLRLVYLEMQNLETINYEFFFNTHTGVSLISSALLSFFFTPLLFYRSKNEKKKIRS